MQQLLWIETLLMLAGGLALVIMPMTLSVILGLARSASRFWPRVLGGLLAGAGLACALEIWRPGIHGLGLAGCVVLNLAGASVLLGLAILGQAAPTTRGRFLVITMGGLLVLLSLVELAFL